jgi:hypothetical protein
MSGGPEVSSTGDLSADLLALYLERFPGVPIYCGDEASVGLDDGDEVGSYALQDTTPDQLRLEDYVQSRCDPRSQILHIGLGNSRLAQRFCNSVLAIVGIAICKSEIDHALSCSIANYLPMLINKYSNTFAGAFGPDFDFVLDNNPTSFCCCYLHFCRMMTTYRRVLRKGGTIVTDRSGLAWVPAEAHPRWSFDFADWARFGAVLGLSARDVNGDVFTMEFVE